ncbi:hypothetical protein HHI36_013718 [Cryptolaemus montrouzieri]|uniref:CRAL-TRIO domain-containing protein n=1 Tax=Cryptolaemus montrouzieri TaxID=559131 RepID=A0ABD2NJ07_9CUCU
MGENIADNRRRVFEASGVTVEIADEKVDVVEKWLRKQTHLPEIPSKHMIEIFLVLNKFNIEVTQRKLEMYYKIRTQIPDLYQNKHPASPHMQKIADVVYCIALPKLSPELYLINVFKLKDTNTKNFDAHDYAAYSLNSAELKLLDEKLAVGEVFIYDLEGVSFGHFFKTMTVLKKLSRVVEEVFSSRVKGIHYINCPRFIDALVSVVRAVMNPKVANRIHIHKSYDTLSEYIPKELLPRDYGGDEKSLDELNEMLKTEFLENKERFDKLDQMVMKDIKEVVKDNQ